MQFHAWCWTICKDSVLSIASIGCGSLSADYLTELLHIHAPISGQYYLYRYDDQFTLRIKRFVQGSSFERHTDVLRTGSTKAAMACTCSSVTRCSASQFLTIVPAMPNLPIAKPYLEHHTYKSCNTYTTRIANSRRRQRELTILWGDFFGDFGKGVDVYQTTEQAFPENDGEDNVDTRDEVEQRMQRQNRQVDYLQERR